MVYRYDEERIEMRIGARVSGVRSLYYMFPASSSSASLHVPACVASFGVGPKVLVDYYSLLTPLYRTLRCVYDVNTVAFHGMKGDEETPGFKSFL